jgi:hypothetical protein
MIFLQDIWSDNAGRIFLITFASYLFGYLVYGGYLFAFFGRNASLPFGLADFSIADLISVFPAAIITIIDIIIKAFWRFLKGLFFHVIIPIVIGVAIRSVTGLRFNQLSIDATWVGLLAFVGIVIWLSSFSISISKSTNVPLVIFILLEIIGSIIFFAAVPNAGEPDPIFPTLTAQTQSGLSIILIIILTLEIIAVPYLFGVNVAKTAIKLNLLTKIDRLTLSQPILKDGMSKITIQSEIRNKQAFKELWLTQRNLPIDIEPNVYEWLSPSDKGTYLIATFEKFVILYMMGLKTEDSHTIVVKRDVILSLEIVHQTVSKNH